MDVVRVVEGAEGVSTHIAEAVEEGECRAVWLRSSRVVLMRWIVGAEEGDGKNAEAEEKRPHVIYRGHYVSPRPDDHRWVISPGSQRIDIRIGIFEIPLYNA